MFRNITMEMNNQKIRLTAILLVAFFLAGTTCVSGKEAGFGDVLAESGTYSCLSPKEAQLLELVNTYRESNGLPVIANSRSLNKVARTHVLDLFVNKPAAGKDINGENCNLHSWSYKGFWTPVCYTKGTHRSESMWYKAKEITSFEYSAPVYENAYWSSDDNADPGRVLMAWKKSPTHNALMLESGIWKGLNIKALGVGIYKGFAVIWVGDASDSLGPMDACSVQAKIK